MDNSRIQIKGSELSVLIGLILSFFVQHSHNNSFFIDSSVAREAEGVDHPGGNRMGQ